MMISLQTDVATAQPEGIVENEILAALRTLQKHNFKEAEFALKKEAGLADSGIAEEFLEFKADGPDDPKSFFLSYEKLLKFVDTCPDQHKLELSSLLYPVFVQLYLRLVSGNYSSDAIRFMEKFRRFQEDYYREDICILSNITEAEHLSTNALVESFRAADFSITIASTSYSILRRFMREQKLVSIQSVLKDQLHVETIDGPPRSKLQLDCRRGAMFGESRREANSERVLYGLLKDSVVDVDTSESCELPTADQLSQNVDTDADLTPSKRKKRKDGVLSSGKMSKSGSEDPHSLNPKSPSIDRIPLPKLSDSYMDSRKSMRRQVNSLIRSTLQQDSDPGTGVIFYTVCNAQVGESALSLRRGGVPCMSFSDDFGLLAVGFGTGRIRIWSLGAESLRQILPPDELNCLDMDDEKVKSRMLHDENGETHPARDLMGHQSSVHGVSFSPDGQLIASVGADGSLRLWSTVLWGGSLTAWRDHVMPIWSVAWPPAYGHYLATGGSDRTARLYACDHAPGPLRIFTGHRADVTTVAFHPNVNYLATGSADRAVRLFDVRSGKGCRVYTGHKGSVQCLAFSPCGRYLASGGWCGGTCLWDLGSGNQVGQLGGYSSSAAAYNTVVGDSNEETSQLLTGPVVALSFCQNGSGRLASAGLEGAVRVWNTGTGRVQKVVAASAPNSSVNDSPPEPPTGAGGLLAAHNTIRDDFKRDTGRSGRDWKQTTETYYSVVGGYELSKDCLRDAFFTRKTSVLALTFVHPYLLLAAGPYNQS